MEMQLPDFLTRYQDPLKAFRFLVSLDGETVGAFSQFSGIKMEVQTIQARSGSDIRGVQEYVPVLTSFAPVTMTRGVFGNNEFLDWILESGASYYTGPKGNNISRTIEVIALDDTGLNGVTWTLKNAMPIRYELSPMDSSRSEVLTESVTFAIQGVDREVSTFTWLPWS